MQSGERVKRQSLCLRWSRLLRQRIGRLEVYSANLLDCRVVLSNASMDVAPPGPGGGLHLRDRAQHDVAVVDCKAVDDLVRREGRRPASQWH